MENEIVLTEVVLAPHPERGEKSVSCTFPNIQKYLDAGYVVKNIFYSPAKEVGYTSGFALTVLLKKVEEKAK